MSGTQTDMLQELLTGLKPVKTAVELPKLLQDAGKKDMSHADFLEEVLSRETTAKGERQTLVRHVGTRFAKRLPV